MKVFVVTSIINMYSEPMQGFTTRSVYTAQDRLNQTLKTIETIRQKNEKSYCILVEYSKLSQDQHKTLSEKVDKMLDLSGDAKGQWLAKSNKSLGDVYAIITGINAIPDDLRYSFAFKMSGRYYLDDNYKESRFDEKDDIIFRKIVHNLPNWKTVCYETKLFGFSCRAKRRMLDYLEKAYRLLQHRQAVDIEHALYSLVKESECKVLDLIGVSGNIAVTGEFQSI